MSEWWEDLEVKPTRYDLGPVPGEPSKSFFRVSLRKEVIGWMIFDAGMCLNKSGCWAESSVEFPNEEWIDQHRWQGPQEAIAFYRVWLREFMEKELGRGA